MGRSRSKSKKQPGKGGRKNPGSGPKGSTQSAAKVPRDTGARKAESTDLPSKSTSEQATSSRALGVRLAIATLFLAIVGFGVATKVAPSYDAVFGHSDVRLLGADSYYHLRHTRAIASHWPALERWDPGTHYPTGQRSQNAGLFDLTAATIAKLTASVSPPTDDDVAAVLAWLPPIFAGLTLVSLFFLGTLVHGPWLGLLIAGLCALYPGGTASKQLLGFADHHALEVLLLTATTTLVAAGLRTSKRGWSIATGVGLALFFFTWAGAPLAIAVVGMAIVISWVALVVAGREPSTVERFTTSAFATAGLGILIVGTVFPNGVLEASLFWPTVAGSVAAAAVAGMSPLISRWLLDGGPRRRLLALAIPLAPIVLVAGAAAVSPAVVAALQIAFGSKLASVAEHANVDLRFLFRFHGLLLAPALWALFAAGSRVRTTRLAVIAIALLTTLLHVVSNDYGYLVAPMLAAAAGLGILDVHERTREWSQGRRALIAVAALALVALPITRESNAKPWPRSIDVDAMALFDDAWNDATTWLRDNTPAPSTSIDARIGDFSERRGGHTYAEDSYGIFVPWSFGNFVAAKARRPVVWSQGASDILAQWWISKDPDAIADAVCGGCETGEKVRYLVIDSQTVGPQAVSLFAQAGAPLEAHQKGGRIIMEHQRLTLQNFGEDFDRALAMRLFWSDGRGLGRYRLVHETPQERLVGFRLRPKPGGYSLGRIAWPVTDERRRELQAIHASKLPSATEEGFVYDTYLGPAIKIFEIVEGATLEGSARPGATITASLALRSGPREIAFLQQGVADENGRFAIRVPYPTGGDSEVRSNGPYRLQIAGTTSKAEVEVTPTDVAEGRAVAVASWSETTVDARN